MDEHLLGVLQLAQDAGVIGNTDLSEEIVERVYSSLPLAPVQATQRCSTLAQGAACRVL